MADAAILTERLVAEAKPPFVWDARVPGFGCRIHPSGKRMYIFQYRTRAGKQRRLSLGGPDPMPGHPFRSSSCNNDFTDPAFTDARVAACDRVLAVQTEYRGHVKLNWSYNPGKDEDKEREEGSGGPRLFWLEGLDVVVFADAGQAWLVGNGPKRVPAGHIPRFDNWLVDVGLGVDWGGFGVYIAKAVTTGERLRFTARLDHRF